MPAKAQPANKPLAYSYVRFSTPEQAAGNSYDRQARLVAEYCKRKNLTLSAATYKDLGVSAYKGKNALVGNLGEFLKAVKSGAVQPGSYLIVESLDRISRQGIDTGYDLVKSILKAGVRLVTLMPEREFDESATRSLTKGAMEIMLILERAAEESERKSDRGKANWRAKRERARAGELLTRRHPAWLAVKPGGGFAVLPGPAGVLKRVFGLAASGYGVPTILKVLNSEQVPPIGRSGRWTRSYLGKLLCDRRVLGELQPMRGKDKDGDAIPNYFPAILTESEWLAARAGATQRRTRPGRTGKAGINVFAGMLTEARTGQRYQMTQRQSRNPGRPVRTFAVLVNAGAEQGTSAGWTIPYAPFEAAVLSALKEIDPSEVLPPDDAGPLPTVSLAAELEGVAAELASAGAYLEKHGFSPTIAAHITKLENRRDELTAQLNDLKQQNSVPLTQAWESLTTLTDALGSADDPTDARLRLRAALRRAVSSMVLLVVPRGAIRLMAVTVVFAGSGARRNIFAVYKPAAKPKGGATIPARWAAVTIKHPGDGLPFSNFDLRQETLSVGDDGEAVSGWREEEQFLEAYPLDIARGLLADGREVAAVG